MQYPRVRLIGIPVVLLLSFSGCGPAKPQLFPVRGELFYQGKAPRGALVQFRPATGGDQPWPSGYPRGEVQADGTFEIGTETSNDGAPAGEYIITATWMVSPSGSDDPESATVDQFQGKYRDPTKSTLKATVTAPITYLPRIDLN
jgi:hypothetical protein